MTKLLMIRHGQSIANVHKIFAGQYDSPLSALGVRQAALTANYIVSHYTVDKVYSSDLRRAYATGKAVADLLGLEVTVMEDLREIWAGDWEGMPFDQLPEKYPETYNLWHCDIGNAVCDGGESVSHLQSRVMEAVTRIAEDNPDKTVVIATHATPIRAVQCCCEGKTLDEMKYVKWVSNASVTELRYENGRMNLETVSYDGHLCEMTTVLPDNC